MHSSSDFQVFCTWVLSQAPELQLSDVHSRSFSWHHLPKPSRPMIVTSSPAYSAFKKPCHSYQLEVPQGAEVSPDSGSENLNGKKTEVRVAH